MRMHFANGSVVRFRMCQLPPHRFAHGDGPLLGTATGRRWTVFMAFASVAQTYISSKRPSPVWLRSPCWRVRGWRKALTVFELCGQRRLCAIFPHFSSSYSKWGSRRTLPMPDGGRQPAILVLDGRDVHFQRKPRHAKRSVTPAIHPMWENWDEWKSWTSQFKRLVRPSPSMATASVVRCR